MWWIPARGWSISRTDPTPLISATAVETTHLLAVPTICILEVFKRMRQQRGRTAAYRVVAQMRLGRVVDLDRKLAITAARVGLAHKLASADSIVLATAEALGATLWTQDADFEGVKGVRYRRKQ